MEQGAVESLVFGGTIICILLALAAIGWTLAYNREVRKVRRDTNDKLLDELRAVRHELCQLSTALDIWTSGTNKA